MLIKNARDYEGRICDYLIADGKLEQSEPTCRKQAR